MATSDRKDNHFFAIFHLFASLSRLSFGKKIFILGSLVKTISDKSLI